MTEILISIKPPDGVRISGVKVNLVCRKCSNTWGIYMRDDYSIDPEQFNCRECRAALTKQIGATNDYPNER